MTYDSQNFDTDTVGLPPPGWKRLQGFDAVVVDAASESMVAQSHPNFLRAPAQPSLAWSYYSRMVAVDDNEPISIYFITKSLPQVLGNIGIRLLRQESVSMAYGLVRVFFNGLLNQILASDTTPGFYLTIGTYVPHTYTKITIVPHYSTKRYDVFINDIHAGNYGFYNFNSGPGIYALIESRGAGFDYFYYADSFTVGTPPPPVSVSGVSDCVMRNTTIEDVG